MNKRIGFGLVFSLVLVLTAGSAFGRERRVSLDVRDVPVEQAIKMLFRNTGLPYTLAPGGEGKVTVKLRDMPFAEALKAVLDAGNLSLIMQDGLYVIRASGPKPDGQSTPRKNEARPSDAGPMVRVGLSSSIGSPKSITVSCSSPFEVLDASGNAAASVSADQKASFTLRDGAIEISTGGIEPISAAAPVRLSPTKSTAIFDIVEPRAKCKRYRGTLEIPSAKKLSLVNELPIEDYVRGVVPFEVPKSFHVEAQKALVVAIRTYALRHLRSGRHASGGFHLCDSTDCQGFAGAVPNCDWVDRLVEETRGQVITHKGELIYATYSTDCGGATQNNEDAGFGRDPWPYLRSVVDNPSGKPSPVSTRPSALDNAPPQEPDPGMRVLAGTNTPPKPSADSRAPLFEDYCAGSPAHSWSKKYSPADLEKALSKSSVKTGKLRSMTFAEYDSSGRVKTIIIRGDAGEERISGNRLRQTLGSSTIKSTRMAVSVTTEGDFLIEGRGFGHGVGLCAFGANGIAKYGGGKTYEQILKHYYTGIEVRTMDTGKPAPASPKPSAANPKPLPKPSESDLVLKSRVSAED